MSKEKGLMVVDDGFSILDFFLFDQFWIFCLINGFWGDGGWVGVDWSKDEYFAWINVYNRH